ncbi:MAG: tetratricopeptide repeat protein [Bacteroidales bacterium]|jgi:serine phosphatase RsbU (regulator of sigma subunit)/Flp pilus assembly protein TadD|nr:tetratricopeptide repeat protein [Bacteroidales bacterium]
MKFAFSILFVLLFVGGLSSVDTVKTPIVYAEKARQLIETNINLSQKYAETALDIAIIKADTQSIAICYYSLGVVYHETGNLNKALKQYEKAVDYAKISSDYITLNLIYNNIGVIYRLTGYIDMATDYLEKSYDYAKLTGDTLGMIYGLSNLANTYATNSFYDKANYYFKQALELAKLNESQIVEIASIENNLGYVNFLNDKFDIAELHYLEALYLFEEAAYLHGEHLVLNRLGELNYKLQNYYSALQFVEKAEKLINENTGLDIIKETYDLIYKINKSLNKTDKALKYFELSKAISDSIETKELKEHIAELESIYENEKLKSDNELKSERIKRQRNSLRLLTILGSFVLLSLILLLKQIIQKNRFNKVLNNQNKLISDQNKTINESIDYAAYILNKGTLNNNNFKQLIYKSFVFYKPKAKVGGDFYRLFHSNNQSLIVVADCTGHGVAGGFLSTLSNQFLERSIDKTGISSPCKTLEELNRLFYKYFNSKGSSVNESMDISLLLLNEGGTAIFAGNKQRLWILKNKTITEYRGNNVYIGYDLKTNFNEQIIKYDKGSKFFLFTDGYADQFGSENNTKMKYPLFKQLIIDTDKMDENSTNEYLQTAHKNWMGEKPQTDDILVMGVFC